MNILILLSPAGFVKAGIMIEQNNEYAYIVLTTVALLFIIGIIANVIKHRPPRKYYQQGEL